MSKIISLMFNDDEVKVLEQFKSIGDLSDDQLSEFLKNNAIEVMSKKVESFKNATPSVNMRSSMLSKLKDISNFKKPAMGVVDLSSWERDFSKINRIYSTPKEADRDYLIDCLLPVYTYLKYVFDMGDIFKLSLSEDGALIVDSMHTREGNALPFSKVFSRWKRYGRKKSESPFSYDNVARFAEELAIQAIRSCGNARIWIHIGHQSPKFHYVYLENFSGDELKNNIWVRISYDVYYGGTLLTGSK